MKMKRKEEGGRGGGRETVRGEEEEGEEVGGGKSGRGKGEDEQK